MYSFKKIKVNINDLKVSSHSLVGVNSLFYPIINGNYFSIKYKDKECNIMNISYENFKELQKNNINIDLIEILKNDISTKGYLLFSKDISTNWYLNSIWTYNTTLNSNDKARLIEYLKLKNLYLNENKKEITIKEDIEKILLDKYNCKSFKFNYLDKENDLIIKSKKDLIERNEGITYYKNIYFIKKSNPLYKVTLYDILNIVINLKTNENIDKYFNENYLGYVVIDKNQNFDFYILNNDNLINFINKIKEYESFSTKCNNLTNEGKYKFYYLLEKEKNEEKEKALNGNMLSKENATIYFQQMLDKLNGLEYVDYSKNLDFNFDINLFVEKIFENKILTSDNELYAQARSTKNCYTFVYFYKCIIEKIINDNEFILRISCNNNRFYYIKFTRINSVWDFKSVTRKKETIINYN